MEKFLASIKIPALDEKARQAVRRRWSKLSQYERGLGKLEDMAASIGAMTGREPRILKKAMILTAGDHGIARYGVSNFPQEVTVQMIKGYLRYAAGANVLARHAGIRNQDLFVVDIGVNADLLPHPQLINKKVAYGTADFTKGPAMTDEQAFLSLKAGFDVASKCIDAGYEMLVLSEMGIGNTTASAAIASVFTGLPPERTVGRGTGIGDRRMAIKRQVVEEALRVNKPQKGEPLKVLAKVGGYELGGLAGVLIAGAARRAPVFIDGLNATAAALIAHGLFPAARGYMLASHLSAEIAHKAMLDILRLEPVLTAGMRLGEGTGAAVVVSLLDAAIAVLNKAA
ncbi:MAG: nicotinate-nucleotide--dimethylbenzimidazole phosphoribosyltransferase [Acidaminococcales bacterium]|jgi:nicotinate-nucleotide--dimethylbenzimidazole phosphoribosyltransferase|nr:nicotinate-nucleotide--dimethylbenzimidazole phosphoribosyltransferase [Acidaminococcales bacterium]